MRSTLLPAISSAALAVAAAGFAVPPWMSTRAMAGHEGHERITSPSNPNAQPLRKGDDWSRFLGPHGTGVSGERGLMQTWPQGGPPKVWGKQIGAGYGAPSVRGRRLVLHHRLGREEIVECMRADDGKTLWRHSYPSNFRDPYGYNNGPRCTPLLTEDHCYTYGAEGMLLCLDLKTGEKLWNRDTQREFGLPEWFFGVGCSPILVDNLLIVLVGGQPNSGVVAFDARTGEIAWQSVGKETWDGAQTDWPNEPVYRWTGDEQIVSYSSPTVATIHGKRHLLCFLRHGLVSLDPADGSLNFKYWFRSREYESVNAARPVVIGDKIFLSSAYRLGSVLLQVDRDGKDCRELWRNRRNILTHWSTAIHVDGYLYGFSGRHENEGTFRCIDLDTGAVVWKTSGFEGDLSQLKQNPVTGEIIDKRTNKAVPWPFFGRGSKIKVDDKFIVLGERGTLALVKINPKKFEEISRTAYREVGYPAWAAPVLSRKRLYLRTEEALVCLDLAPTEPAE